MNINKALVKWRKTKDISLASDICSTLIEMLEDEDCVVISSAPSGHRDALVRLENDNHEMLLIRQNRMNWKRVSVLEDKDEQ